MSTKLKPRFVVRPCDEEATHAVTGREVRLRTWDVYDRVDDKVVEQSIETRDLARDAAKRWAATPIKAPLTPKSLRRITHAEFFATLKAQGVPADDMAVVCPNCGTVQSRRSFLKAGTSYAAADTFLGFSCVGRQGSHVGTACNWSLGGLFQIHTLEVTTPDGAVHKSFEPASSDQARLCMQVNKEK